MLKKLKKYVAFALAVGLLFGETGSVVQAAGFSFSLSGYGASERVSASKGNYLSYASGSVTQGNLSSSNYMNFTLYDSSVSNPLSDTKQMTSNSSFKLFYSGTTPQQNITIVLKASCGYYDAYASGNWTP